MIAARVYLYIYRLSAWGRVKFDEVLDSGEWLRAICIQINFRAARAPLSPQNKLMGTIRTRIADDNKVGTRRERACAEVARVACCRCITVIGGVHNPIRRVRIRKTINAAGEERRRANRKGGKMRMRETERERAETRR